MTNLDKQEIIQILRRCELFLGLEDEGLMKVASLASISQKSFKTGDVISHEAEAAEKLYILIEGKVELRMNIPLDLDNYTREITVDTVSRGSVFHWSALVRPYVLSRTSCCAEDCKVLSINGKELIKLMDNNMTIGYEIMQSIAYLISSRLRTPNNYFWAETLRRWQ